MTDITQRAIQAETTLRQRDLAKMKWIAAGLLGAAACLYVIGKLFEGQHPAWGYLVAFAEAAMIGAMADWFAVVALFRHPLGVPIPHTAIIPRKKRAIGNSLADFVVGQFLSTEVIEQRLRRYDAARHFSQWLSLSENRNKVAGYLNQAISYGVKVLDDRRIHDFLTEAARNKLRAIDLSEFMVNGLELINRNNSHRKILHGGLHRFADYVESPDNTDRIAEFIKGWSESAWIQSMIEPFIPSIRSAVIKKLRAVAEDDSSALYLEFDEQVRNYVLRLQQDPELRAWVNQQKNAVLNRPEFGNQIESLWSQLRDWVVLDLSRPDSVLASKLAGLLEELEQHLVTHEEMRSWLNDQIRASLTSAAHANKGVIGDLIREEVVRWDDKYMVNRLELFLGKDLQFIRINGTLVGGLFGLLIYGVTMLVEGF